MRGRYATRINGHEAGEYGGRDAMSDYLGHEDACPICFYKLDAATCVDGNARPKPGDLTVCINCAELLVFDESLRHSPLDEHGGLDSLESKDRDLLIATQTAIRENSSWFKRMPKRKPS